MGDEEFLTQFHAALAGTNYGADIIDLLAENVTSADVAIQTVS